MKSKFLNGLLGLGLLLLPLIASAQMPFSPCSPTGGKRADILSAEAKYRAPGGAAPVFTIPAGTKSIAVYVSSETGIASGTTAVDKGDEDFLTINAVIDLPTGTSSGFVNYAKSTYINGSGTNVYGWKNVPVNGFIPAASKTGDASPDLNNVNFSISGTTLTITESNTNTHSSYYVEYVSPYNSSLNPLEPQVRALLHGTGAANRNLGIPIPAGADIVLISGKGTNSSAADLNDAGGVEEGFSNLRFAIDLNAGLTDGFVTLANGASTGRRSTYVVNNISSTYNGDLVAASSVAGDFTGKSTAEGAVGLFNARIYISGNSLIIERDADYARDFDDAYIVEFYTRLNQGMSAEFIDSDVKDIPKGQGSTAGTSRTFKIPSGTNFIYFNETGNAVNADREENENSLAAYGYIDLNTETVTGYFYQQVGLNQTTRRDDNYAFKNVPLDGSSTRNHASREGYASIQTGTGNTNYDISFTLSADKSELTVTNVPGLVSNAYQFLLSADFYGSRPDAAFNVAITTFTKGGTCKTVTANVTVCNPGSGYVSGGMPISFYSGDPTSDPTAVLLATSSFNQDIAVGECKNFSFDIDLSQFNDLNIDLTMIINDNGSFVPGGVGNAVGTPFTLQSLASQGSLYKECYFDNNILTSTINVNNCPVVNLDPDKSSGATGNYNYLNYFTAGSSTGSRIADVDVSIVDPDAGNLSSATITLTNPLNGAAESLNLNGVLPAGISISGDGTGTITLSGVASQADYVAALKMIEYRNSNGTPNTTNRTITTVLNDGIENGPASTTTIVILTNSRINVTGNGTAIADATTTTTNTGDGTDFGVTQASGGLINHTFTIQNVGTGTINLTGVSPDFVTISGDPGFTITTQPAATSLASSVSTTFVVSFDPASHALGAYTATISIPNNDPDAGRSNYTFNVSVAVNNQPTVGNSTVSTNEDTQRSFAAADFTDPYTDIDNTPLSKIRISSLPLNGSFRLNGTVITVGQEIAAADLGNITFTPTQNWSGTTSFQWSGSDGTSYSAAPATMTINVAPVNDAPVITVPTSLTINEDDPLALSIVTFGDIDALAGMVTATFTVPDGMLNATSAGGVTVGGSSTSMTLQGTLQNINTFLANGGISYTASANPPTSVVINILLEDNGNTGSGGALSDAETLTIGIVPSNDPPTGTPDAPVTNEDVPVNGTVTGSDPEGDVLSFAKATDPANGTVVVNADGTYTYTPNAGYNGPDSFTVTVSDGNGGTATVTVNVTVNPVNGLPTGTPDAPVTNEDVPVNGTVTGSDPDGDALTFIKATDPANGTVVVNVDGTYTYTPNAGYNGPDSFTVTVSDGNGGTTTVTVNVTVNPVNDAPTGTPDVPVTNEDVPVNGTVTGSDPDGDALTFTKATDPVNGTVVVNPDGTYTYTPNAGYNGPDIFTVTVSDGNGGTATVTVNVTVNPVNDAPTGTPDTPITNEDTPVNGKVTGSDPDGDVLTFTKGSDPAHGTVTVNADGTYTYTPDAGYSGSDNFTVTISDGKGGTTTVTVNVTVNPVNDAPTGTPDTPATTENTPVNGKVTGSDPDGDALTFTKGSDPAHGTVTVNTDGTYTYTPDAGYSGSDNFTVTISDGKDGILTVTVNVTINPGQPRITMVKTATLSGAEIIYTFTITNTGSALLNNITLSDPKIGISNKSIPVGGGLAPGASITHTETYTLKANEKESASFTNTATVEAHTAGGVKVSDVSGTGANNDNATVLTLPLPQAQDNTSATREGRLLVINLLDNDSPSQEGTPLVPSSVEIITQPANGTLTVNPDGTVSYQPRLGFLGQDAFSYRVKDQNGFASNVATVRITVNENLLEVPNVVTPNGDGHNDKLVIKGLEKYRANSLYIYNRWSNKVFERRNYQGEWDGTGLNAGTYFYSLEVQDENGQWHKVNGYIMLLR